MALTEKTIAYLRDNCVADLKGKTVLITGANSGIGYKTAETMLWAGASVIMACRNLEKAEKAREQLKNEYASAEISILELDLSDFDSIERFANSLPDIDVFVNNAGILTGQGRMTKQGFEMVMGTNYLGLYYITEAILPKLRRLKHDVVYINTGSIIHKAARIDYNSFDSSKGAYARSKLCIARYTNYLASRLEKTNVHVYMNHPGMAVTPIAAHIAGPLYRMAGIVPINSAEKSSLSVIWLLSHKVPEGAVIGPKGFLNAWGYPGVNRQSRKASRQIEELIKYTDKLIKR